jgi:flavin-binding protein dodecin
MGQPTLARRFGKMTKAGEFSRAHPLDSARRLGDVAASIRRRQPSLERGNAVARTHRRYIPLPGTGGPMAIHKVIEVISQSEKSWEDAAQRAVADAGKSVEQIKSIWIKNFEAVIKDNKIVEYRVNANITFEVKQ